MLHRRCFYIAMVGNLDRLAPFGRWSSEFFVTMGFRCNRDGHGQWGFSEARSNNQRRFNASDRLTDLSDRFNSSNSRHDGTKYTTVA